MAEEAEAAQIREHQAILPGKTEKAEKPGAFNPFGRIAEAVGRTHPERSAAVLEKSRDNLRDLLAQIAVVAFIGPSGTGKSTHAGMVARQYKIAYILDDGLLIHGSRILAGTSAKKAASKLDSVRQALFADETRAVIVRRALAAHRPTTLMILGTSEGMLNKICENLWLNPPSMMIRIEDVSTDEEIRKAKQIRLSEGKHAIPVPSMEIKHEFSGHFADPLSRLRRRRDRLRGLEPAVADPERTVVRPTFSGLGSYSISDDALSMMIEIIIRRIRGVAGLVGFKTETEISGVVIDLDLSLFYGFNAPQVLQEVQERVSRQIEEYTSINVIVVNVKARRIVHPPAAQRGQTQEGR
jgi:hypothetical protein